jgi:lipid-A-disaccharide synthase-like uncharacterized protein
MLEEFLHKLTWWTAFGMVFQGAFAARFIVQWIASERRGRSVVPVSFWYISILAGAGLMIYAIGQADAVFTLGQGAGLAVYIRNVALINREKRRAPEVKDR